MLATGKGLAAATAAGGKFLIEVSQELRTDSDDVIAIEW